MRRLDLQSEQFSATGNVASEGVLNQLGRPNLDLLTLLVRETVQNSWDARLSDSETVHFGISGWTLTEAQLELLRNVIFANEPGSPGLSSALSTGREFQVLAVYDRGTTGLGGPTRADVISDRSEPRNFVNFLRNVGQPSGKRLGGGTFGYGKAALYLASSMRTVCVHTHCLSEGRPESRFIAAALGPRYEEEGPDRECHQYTGRHWWGRNEEGIVEPVCGAEADDLAQHLGLPSFIGSELGTTLLLLLPVLGESSLLASVQRAAVLLPLNFWPKMLVQKHGLPAMTFRLSWEGQPVPVPEPREFPPLQGFVQAMEKLKMYSLNSVDSIVSRLVPIDCYNPKRHLGLLSLQRFPVKERREPSFGGEEGILSFREPCHHVALMRKAELIVKYVSGPPLPTGQIEYAGVFVVDEQIDSIFAKAEPPTHDDWNYQSLDDPNEKTFVRMAHRRIQEALKEFTDPPSLVSKSVGIFPLGAFADKLGGLLLGAEGSGASVQPFAPVDKSNSPGSIVGRSKSDKGSKSPSGSGGIVRERTPDMKLLRGTQRARISLIGDGRLELIENVPALLTEFVVEHSPGSRATLVKVEAAALLDGDELEKDPPIGGQTPDVLLWITPDGVEYSGSPEISIPRSSTGIWGVVVSIPDDVMVSMTLRASEVE